MFDRTKKQLSTTLEICINISKVKCVLMLGMLYGLYSTEIRD